MKNKKGVALSHVAIAIITITAAVAAFFYLFPLLDKSEGNFFKTLDKGVDEAGDGDLTRQAPTLSKEDRRMIVADYMKLFREPLNRPCVQTHSLPDLGNKYRVRINQDNPSQIGVIIGLVEEEFLLQTGDKVSGQLCAIYGWNNPKNFESTFLKGEQIPDKPSTYVQYVNSVLVGENSDIVIENQEGANSGRDDNPLTNVQWMRSDTNHFVFYPTGSRVFCIPTMKDLRQELPALGEDYTGCAITWGKQDATFHTGCREKFRVVPTCRFTS